MWHGLDLTVDGGDRKVSGRYMLAVVSNVRLYAGGLATISPAARLDDGRMDLWLFEGRSLEDTLQQAWDLWSGRHVRSERVQCIPFEKISLQAEAPIYLQLDGEPGYTGECLNIEVAPQALRVLVPKTVPQALFARPAIAELDG
jgi:diacylglycerol kinase family enzyme